MSVILERMKAKQQAERMPDKWEMTAQNLLDTLYEAIDSGKIDKNARVIFNNEFYVAFMCKHCNFWNEKEYRSTMYGYEVDLNNSSHSTLSIFIRAIKRR